MYSAFSQATILQKHFLQLKLCCTTTEYVAVKILTDWRVKHKSRVYLHCTLGAKGDFHRKPQNI